ncbi:MAG: metallophosphoesterase [Rhabdochlamydiaceae bacterium]|jgi:3',5'-cyclic AMP phosphodiesterase CpdA
MGLTSFGVGDEPEIYTFQTLGENKPLKFVVGGDAYYKRDLFEKMNKEVAKQDPDFVVMGGDIAYTVGGGRGIFKGREWEISRWKAFFKAWQSGLVKSNGHLIPIIPVVGNHDVRRKDSDQEALFYKFFSLPREYEAYQVIDVGEDVSLFLLDTGHTSPIDGAQTDWLNKVLEERRDRKVKLAGYHIAAFPSFYSYDKGVSVKIRENWVPLFERYGVSAAFEHHNHCYKRTHPIKEEKIDPQGIIYLGDGSWGIPPRIPLKPGVIWYLAETRSENAYFLVSIENGKVVIEPRRNNGKLIEPVITVQQPL